MDTVEDDYNGGLFFNKFIFNDKLKAYQRQKGKLKKGCDFSLPTNKECILHSFKISYRFTETTICMESSNYL